MIKHVDISELQKNCLALLDEVIATGVTIVITKNGKPTADLIPFRESGQTTGPTPTENVTQ